MFNIVAIISLKVVTSLAKEMATLGTSKALASSIYNVGKRIYLATTSTSSPSREPADSSIPSSSPELDDAKAGQINESKEVVSAEQASVNPSEHNEATTNLLSTLTSTLSLFAQINPFKIQQQNFQQKHPDNDSQINDNSTEYLVYNWLENLFAKFQMIVIWQEPLSSAYAIGALLSSYM